MWDYHHEMKLTLRFKTIAVFLLTLSVSMTSILMSGYYLTVTRQIDEYIGYNTKILELEADSIEFHLNQLLQSSLSFYRANNLMNALRGTGDQFNDAAAIRSELYSMLNSSPYITQIHLYSSIHNMDYVASTSSSASQQSSETKSEDRLPYNKVRLIRQSEPDYGFPINIQSEDVITLSRSIYDFPRDRYLGHIDIDMNLSHFQNMAKPLSEKEILSFVSADGEILYCSGNLPIIKSILPSLEIGTEKYNEDNLSLDEYTAISVPVVPNGFIKDYFLIQVIPKAAITGNARIFASQNLLIGLLISLVAMLFMIKILTGYTRPFGYIETQLKKVSAGNLNVKMDIQGNTEFGGFAKQFNEMIDSINNLIIHGYKLEISNKNYQLKALQAQMDPHFINNALQNIGAEALKNNNRNLYSIIMQFGEMMRYTMDFKSLMVPLKYELRYTANYLNFQAMRFRNKFTYTIHAQEETMDIEVPKLLLQPLAENIFKHGQPADGKLIHININTYIDDETLRIECRNDGKGLSSSELTNLRKTIENARNTEEESQHIGLINLSRRLSLVYGEKGHIDIDSENGVGFSVVITIRRNL